MSASSFKTAELKSCFLYKRHLELQSEQHTCKMIKSLEYGQLSGSHTGRMFKSWLKCFLFLLRDESGVCLTVELSVFDRVGISVVAFT